MVEVWVPGAICLLGVVMMGAGMAALGVVGPVTGYGGRVDPHAQARRLQGVSGWRRAFGIVGVVGFVLAAVGTIWLNVVANQG